MQIIKFGSLYVAIGKRINPQTHTFLIGSYATGKTRIEAIEKCLANLSL